MSSDQGPRTTFTTPSSALDGEPGLREVVDALAPGYRTDHVVQVEGARTEATRSRRVAKVRDSLR